MQLQQFTICLTKPGFSGAVRLNYNQYCKKTKVAYDCIPTEKLLHWEIVTYVD